MRGNIYAYDDGISHYEGSLRELSSLTLYSENTLQKAYYDGLEDKSTLRNYTVKKLRLAPRAIDDPDYFRKWRANNKERCAEYRRRNAEKNRYQGT